MMDDNDFLEENVEGILIDGSIRTPDYIRGRIDMDREVTFDLPLVAKPVVMESQRQVRPEKLTAEERDALDFKEYNLERGVVGEKRFRTEFDYFAALIRASEDNADKVFRLKRKTLAMSYIVTAKYNELYDHHLMRDGRKAMGTNEQERKAWMRWKYPALVEIKEMYDSFLDEIDIELDRWTAFSKAASRQLSSTELGFEAAGKLYTHKRGKYDVGE